MFRMPLAAQRFVVRDHRCAWRSCVCRHIASTRAAGGAGCQARMRRVAKMSCKRSRRVVSPVPRPSPIDGIRGKWMRDYSLVSADPD